MRLRGAGSKCAEPETWVALEALHARGKKSIPSGTLALVCLRLVA